MQLALLLAILAAGVLADKSMDNEPMASTLAIVPVQVFRNGSFRVADLEVSKSNASQQQNAVSSVSLDEYQKNNNTLEAQLRNRNK